MSEHNLLILEDFLMPVQPRIGGYNFCNAEIDNLTHIYVTCEKTQEFWIDIIRFINSMFPHIMSLNTIDIIFGTYMSDIHLSSFIVLSAKYFILLLEW